MKIELEFKDNKEFSEFVSAFNNAIIAYDDVRFSKMLGCDTSPKWDDLSEEKMLERRILLLDKYFDFLNKEIEISQLIF